MGAARTVVEVRVFRDEEGAFEEGAEHGYRAADDEQVEFDRGPDDQVAEFEGVVAYRA